MQVRAERRGDERPGWALTAGAGAADCTVTLRVCIHTIRCSRWTSNSRGQRRREQNEGSSQRSSANSPHTHTRAHRTGLCGCKWARGGGGVYRYTHTSARYHGTRGGWGQGGRCKVDGLVSTASGMQVRLGGAGWTRWHRCTDSERGQRRRECEARTASDDAQPVLADVGEKVGVRIARCDRRCISAALRMSLVGKRHALVSRKTSSLSTSDTTASLSAFSTGGSAFEARGQRWDDGNPHLSQRCGLRWSRW